MTSNRKWTFQNDTELIRLWNGNRSIEGEISEILDRSVRSLQQRVIKIRKHGIYMIHANERTASVNVYTRQGRKPVKTGQDIMIRKCLRCGKEFSALGKYIRTCFYCRRRNQRSGLPWII